MCPEVADISSWSRGKFGWGGHFANLKTKNVLEEFKSALVSIYLIVITMRYNINKFIVEYIFRV